MEAATGEDRVLWTHAASAKANTLDRRNRRDGSKGILESTGAHDRKHRGVPAALHGSPELGHPPAACGLAPDTPDRDKGSPSSTRSAGGHTACWAAHTAHLRRGGARRAELQRGEHAPREAAVASGRFSGQRSISLPPGRGEGPAEEDTRDSKAGKFTSKILGTFKGKK